MGARTRYQNFLSAKAEGRAARLAGTPRDGCPYRAGPYGMKAMGWLVGWDGAYDTAAADQPSPQPPPNPDPGLTS